MLAGRACPSQVSYLKCLLMFLPLLYAHLALLPVSYPACYCWCFAVESQWELLGQALERYGYIWLHG